MMHRRLRSAERRLKESQARIGKPFGLESELQTKLQELRAVDAALVKQSEEEEAARHASEAATAENAAAARAELQNTVVEVAADQTEHSAA